MVRRNTFVQAIGLPRPRGPISTLTVRRDGSLILSAVLPRSRRACAQCLASVHWTHAARATVAVTFG